MTSVNAAAARGIKVLLGRQALLQVLTFGAGVVLARTLEPAQFGLYFIASFFVSIFAFFGDFGLAPSLIQRRDELTDRELRVAFTVQQIVTSVVVAALFLASPWVARLYPKAPHETVWLIRVLAFSLYLDSWRSLSVLQLERSLRYRRVAAIEIVEALVYQSLAVGLALAGLGVWSFVIAALARGVLGTGVAFALAPWRVGFCVDRGIARGLLRFGIPFQFASLAQQAGSWLTPVFVGALIGPQAVGLLTWASSNARKPLMVVENVMRVAFPHFSRLQDDPAEVRRVLARYLRLLLLASSGWFALIVVAAPGLVPTVYGDKWRPAVPALVVFAGALSFDTIAWVLGIALAGQGSVGALARVNLVRTLVNVGLGAALVLVIGRNGVPIATLVSGVAVLPLFVRALGGAGRLLGPLAPLVVPFAASLVVGMLSLSLPLPRPAAAALAGVLCVTVFLAVAVAVGLLPVSRLRRTPAPARLKPEGTA